MPVRVKQRVGGLLVAVVAVVQLTANRNGINIKHNNVK